MTKDIIFISFYTPQGKYPELANKLKKSLDKFQLRSNIVKVEDTFKNWEEATHYKSYFILQSLLRFRTSIVWLDIDTEIWKFPKLLFEDNDFAIYNWYADKDHHLDGKIPYNPDSKILKCSGGVQKYGYTAPSMHLLLSWIDNINKRDKNKPCEDDPFLDLAYNTGNFNLKPLWLPKTYNRMDKHSEFWSRISNESVYINHDYKGGNHRNPNHSADKVFYGKFLNSEDFG